MSTEQHVEQQWETPSHEQIIELTKTHVSAMEQTDHEMVWIQAGMHHVLLTTVGRRTGNTHKVALPTWSDPDGVRVVVGSFAGHERHPAWLLNLLDADANPRVHCRVQDGEFWTVPEVLTGGPEHERLWSLLTADRAWYNDYQARTERTIPLVRLPESP